METRNEYITIQNSNRSSDSRDPLVTVKKQYILSTKYGLRRIWNTRILFTKSLPWHSREAFYDNKHWIAKLALLLEHGYVITSLWYGNSFWITGPLWRESNKSLHKELILWSFDASCSWTCWTNSQVADDLNHHHDDHVISLQWVSVVGRCDKQIKTVVIYKW